MYIYSFEKLEVWKLSKSLTLEIYDLTTQFPIDERYLLVSQMRRASISICSNLAEGNYRKTYPDRVRFFTFAYSSSLELLNHLIISYELSFITDTTYIKIREILEVLTAKINAFTESQKKL